MSNEYNVSETDFDKEVIQSSVPVIVDFWAQWCVPCLQIAPVLEGLAEKFVGQVKLRKVNVDEAPALAAKFGVQGIPTILFIKDGKEVDRTIGVVPQAKLESQISSLLS